jgi:hypothetical protein
MGEERLEEIKRRKEEIEIIQRPMWHERQELADEAERIHELAVREIVSDYKWMLKYDKEREQIIIEPIGYDEHREIAKKIYKHAGNSYHTSFNLQDGKYMEVPTLRIDDGEVRIIFRTIEIYRTNTLGLDIDVAEASTILDTLRTDLKHIESILLEE